MIDSDVRSRIPPVRGMESSNCNSVDSSATSEARSRRATSVYACSLRFTSVEAVGHPWSTRLSRIGALPDSMAKHGRRRRRFNLRKVRSTANVAAGALAAQDVTVGPLTLTSTNPYRLMSLDLAWSLTDIGATNDSGFEFGVSHSNYTAAEVEECLEAETSIDIGAKVEQEQANRLVRSIGFMTGAPGSGAGMSFNDGQRVKTRLNWHIGIGNTVNIWIRNGSSVVWTTGAQIVTNGTIWIKDAV